MKKSGIYSIKHIESGRVYIGSSAWMRKRLYDHRHLLGRDKHTNIHLQRAWNLYGADAFEFSVVEEVTDHSLLVAKEQEWIDKTKASDPHYGFNLCSVAGSRRDAPLPEWFGEKMRQVNTGLTRSPETRAKMSAAKKGKPKSEATKAKLRECAKRQFADPERRKQAVEYGKMARGKITRIPGRKASAATKAKMALAAKARMTTEEGKRNLRKIQSMGAAKRLFTEEQITAIRGEAEAGFACRDLAKKYGVSRSNIHHIITRKTYKHIL